jgi:hypothetical protein
MPNNNWLQAQIVNRFRNIHEDVVTAQCPIFPILSIVLILFESKFRDLSGNIMHGHWCRVSCVWLDTFTPTGILCLGWFIYRVLCCFWCPEIGTDSIDSARVGLFCLKTVRESSLRNVSNKNYETG